MDPGVKRETDSAWRLAGWSSGVFVVALVFAVSAIAWMLLPSDAPIRQLFSAAMVALFVALVVLIARQVTGSRWSWRWVFGIVLAFVLPIVVLAILAVNDMWDHTRENGGPILGAKTPISNSFTV